MNIIQRRLCLNIHRSFGFAAKKQRHAHHRSVQKADIDAFRSILGSETAIETTSLEKYNSDWMNKYHGESSLVLKPNSTEQISKILKYCSSQCLPVVPQSGNTGLVGGSVPHHDEIILSMERFNRILSYDQTTDIVTTEAGVILDSLNSYLTQYSTEAPYDLGAKGSCYVGGNVATHAGGISKEGRKYLVKHGPLRGYVIGLKAVLASGEILDLSSKSRKDNTGIDLKQLFIGSEGSLGIITEVNLLCVPIAREKDLLLVKTDSYAKIMEIFEESKSILGKNLAAIEWMDSFAFQAVLSKMSASTQNPFASQNVIEQSYYVLIEVNSSRSNASLLEVFYERIESRIGEFECVAASTEKQFEDLWRIRETVGAACGKYGKVFKYDISLPSEKMDEITKDLRDRCNQVTGGEKTNAAVFTVGYGHIGDGNLHINIAAVDKTKEEALEKLIEPYIFEWVTSFGGSISAEHGLGVMKAEFLHLQKEQDVIKQMIELKKVFDPLYILNPYKILPGV